MRKNVRPILFLSILPVVILLGFPEIAKADMMISPASLVNPLVMYLGYGSFLVGFFIGTAIEISLAYFVFLRKIEKNILAVFIANLVSYPLLVAWTLSVSMLELGIDSLTALFVGEIAVVILEAIIIKNILKERISYPSAFGVSFGNNLSSFVIGWIIFSAIIINLIPSQLVPTM